MHNLNLQSFLETSTCCMAHPWTSQWVCIADTHSFSTRAGKRIQANLPDQISIHNKAILLHAGFTDQQTARVLAFYHSQRLNLNIKNIWRWLQVLQEFEVEQPFAAASRHPILLKYVVEHAPARVAEKRAWLISRGLAEPQMASVLSKWPVLLTVTLAKLTAVDTWLVGELGWDSSRICRVLLKHPVLFSFNSEKSFALKLAWFKAQGFTTKMVSRALSATHALFNNSIRRNENQLSALQALGLSQVQVAAMVMQIPTLLNFKLCGPTTQNKILFLTLVMGKQVTDLVMCPVFLTRSLSNRIGPRWAFWASHRRGKAFNMSSALAPTDVDFVKKALASSPSISEECVTTGVTPLQLLTTFTAQWQQGEGREWCSGKLYRGADRLANRE